MPHAEVEPIHPVRDIFTYIRLVSLAINLRKKDTTIQRDFRVIMPFKFVPDICRNFPEYQYNILGFACQQQTDAIVRFAPIFK